MTVIHMPQISPKDEEEYGTWDEATREFTWDTPRTFGVWCAWNANGEEGPVWFLGDLTPPEGGWDYGVCVGEFEAARWAEAADTFYKVVEWAIEALPPVNSAVTIE